MLIQKENQPINNINEINRDEINNNLEEVNSNSNSNSAQNNNSNQNNNGIRNHGGFDIFLSHGLNAQEIRTLRLIFHLSAAKESIINGTSLDWSPEGIYQREERWLINQISNIYNRNRNLIKKAQELDNQNFFVISSLFITISIVKDRFFHSPNPNISTIPLTTSSSCSL